MRRPSVKKITLALTISSLALTLTACSGAGPNASTRLIKQVTDGVEAKVLTDGNDLRIVS